MNAEEALVLVQSRLADDIAERNWSFAGRMRQLKLHLVKENMWSSTVAVTQMQDLATAEFKARKNLILQTWQDVLSTLDSVNRTLLRPQAAQNAAQALAAERDHLETVVTSQSVGGIPNPAGFLGEVCVLATRRIQAEFGIQETAVGQVKSSGRRTKVFISYAREDIDYARKMFLELENASYEPWLDCESLLPGQRWESTIEQAMRESRYVLALISSRSSVKRGYVQKEIRRALDLLEQIPENDIFLIPVRLDQCEPNHSALRGVQWVDLFPSWEVGVEKIIRALKSGAGAA